MTTLNITAPLTALRGIVSTGPVSAWPDSGDWEDEYDWVVGVAYMQAFDNSSVYVVEEGDDSPCSWTCVAERLQKEAALELAQLLNALRESP